MRKLKKLAIFQKYYEMTLYCHKVLERYFRVSKTTNIKSPASEVKHTLAIFCEKSGFGGAPHALELGVLIQFGLKDTPPKTMVLLDGKMTEVSKDKRTLLIRLERANALAEQLKKGEARMQIAIPKGTVQAYLRDDWPKNEDAYALRQWSGKLWVSLSPEHPTFADKATADAYGFQKFTHYIK